MTVVRDTVWVTLGALLLGVMAAGIVHAGYWAPELRDWYGLTPEHPADAPVTDLWWTNLQAASSIFIASALVDIWPRLRVATDAWVTLAMAFNVLMVAVAFAAYGSPLLRLSLAHSLLELLALAVVTAVYMDARREWRDSTALAGAIVIAVLLLTAAVLESDV